METERGEETEEVGYGSAHHSADFGGRKKKKNHLMILKWTKENLPVVRACCTFIGQKRCKKV